MLTLTLLCGLAFAAPKAPAPKADPAHAAKLEKIRALLALTGSDKTGANILIGLRAQLPPEQYEAMARIFKPEELTEKLVAIFDRHYSADEIDGQLAFYKTPLGKRMIAEGPAITTESVKASQEYALSKLAELRSHGDVPSK